jgi:hypothetical protein
MEIENSIRQPVGPRTLVVARHRGVGAWGGGRGTQRKAGGPTRASIGAINFGEFDFLLANATNTAGIAENFLRLAA